MIGLVVGLVVGLLILTCLVTGSVTLFAHTTTANFSSSWKEPGVIGSKTFQWRDDFSRDIVPRRCLSHNDYTRTVPLYEALAAGCVSIEVDVWLHGDELLVGHTWDSTKRERTLNSLYLEPLINIFVNRNVSLASEETNRIGVFDADPAVSVILLVDFKSDGQRTWPALLRHLQPLRKGDWITYYDGQKLRRGPLTVVGTGNTPFELVQQNDSDRFVFMDAPLGQLPAAEYNSSNSVYASMQFKKAVGGIAINGMTSSQEVTTRRQMREATAKGLISRYWDIPSWPPTLKHSIYTSLAQSAMDMLNVDDLADATLAKIYRADLGQIL
ncbi:hypothetical protein BS50DRAFT_597407 [Corynespora cassiicola Philippines]|uniref:Altered inheritance of mitochondria protein 6 n=1 Tax=Corynespora cassiicola Philippines TaxID=1448308 RepID=A0A2T2P2M5_CORCC|nr:hypothetical protein BS50DRAFT_597407 [Corynespora cassiicola Philippines]